MTLIEYIPDVKPIKNWQLGIQEFYKKGGKEKIEKDAQNFAEVMAGTFGKSELKLKPQVFNEPEIVRMNQIERKVYDAIAKK